MRRRAAKVDANHVEIVKALRAAGCSVVSTASLGCGIGDVLVSRAGETWMFEIKDGAKPPSARKLTPDELAFAASWQGKYAVVESADQAVAIVRAG